MPIQVGSATNWNDVLAGQYHTIAIKSDNTIWGTGDNSDGRLGDGTTISKNIFTRIGNANDWQAIGIGAYNTIAIKTNGTLWACGKNYNGLLGDGTTIQRNILTQIGTDTNWKFATTGEYNTKALKTNNYLFTWGENTAGLLGNGSADFYSLVPVNVSCTNLSIKEQESLSFYIYPNPTNSVLHIQFSEITDILKLRIVDMNGNIVKEQKGNFNEINVQDLAVGNYIITIATNDKVFNQKFAKN